MVLVTVAVVPHPSSRAARPVGTHEQDNAVDSRLVVSSTQVRERRGFFALHSANGIPGS